MISIYTHPACLSHDTGPGHPEQSARLSVVLAALKEASYADKLGFIEAPPAREEDLDRAHDYAAALRAAAPAEDRIFIDGDTVMSPGSLKAALHAAGAGVAAVDSLLQGEAKTAFCAVRPPGHHATRDRAMGFCLFNNIAVAALYALEKHDIQRIAIVDFDVHHGNGTQDIVAGDKRLFYISTHQMPLFPGTGRKEENVDGHILNLPLPAGVDGADYRKVFTQRLLPPLESFAPELLLVSAGFDAHRDDPLAGLALAEEDYRWIGDRLRLVADRHCGGRSISFLEGGYNLQHLAESVVAYLEAWA